MKAGAGGIALIGTVARRLGPLREEVAFLGGAAVSLFVSDPAAPEVRSTKDVDLIVEVASRLSYYGLADRYVSTTLRHDPAEIIVPPGPLSAASVG